MLKRLSDHLLLTKPDHLVLILNQINNNIQFTMVKSQARLQLLGITISTSGTKIWMDSCNKPKNSRRYVPVKFKTPTHCLINIPFSHARRICAIAESEYVKEKRFKELKNTLLKQKYHMSQIEASILRAKEITLKALRKPKTTKNEEIISLTITYNPKTPNVFLIIRQSLDNFHQCTIMTNIF